MAVDRRMNTLASDFQTKKILSAYRARDADKWSSYKQERHRRTDQLLKFYERQEDSHQEDFFQAKYNILDSRSTTTALNMNADAESFSQSVSTFTFPHTPDRTIQKYDAVGAMTIQWKQRASLLYDKQDGKSSLWDDDDNISLGENKVQTGELSPWRCVNNANALPLNDGQAQIIETYRKYLQYPEDQSVVQPPAVVLLTGKGGTGKSFVIHRLLMLGNTTKQTSRVWTMASNNLNAADINGSTIASLQKQRIQKRQKDELKIVQRKISPAAVIGLEKQNVQDLRLIIIDEVSNVTASKLGELSRLFSEVLQNPDQFFGGIRVLLVGDFNQKEPVGGILATTSLIKKVKNKIGHSKHTTNSEHRMKKKQKLSIETTMPSLLDAKLPQCCFRQ